MLVAPVRSRFCRSRHFELLLGGRVKTRQQKARRAAAGRTPGDGLGRMKNRDDDDPSLLDGYHWKDAFLQQLGS